MADTSAPVTAVADPAALVDAAMRSLDGNYGQTDDEIRAFPAVRAIITAPGSVRRQCILIAARQEQWAGTRLLHYIARKRAGLTLGDVEAVLPPPVSQRNRHDSWVDARKLDSLIGQIEATWKSLDDAGRAQLLPQLDRVATETADSATATRLRKLTAAAGGEHVPYTLIDDTSEVGKALRSAIAAAPEPDAAKAKLVRLLADYPATGKPAGKWHEAALLVRDVLHQPAETVGSLLDTALDAPDYEHKYHGSTHRIMLYATKRDEAVLCGIAVLAGQVAAGSDDLLPRLRRLALKAVMFIGEGVYGNPRSIRLANHCVEAIAAAAVPSSITELIKTERGTRHGSLLRQVRKSVDALAAAQGLTRGELLEMTVEAHGLSPDGTRRVVLPEAWLAVIETDARTARLSYTGPGGKPRTSLPATVKEACAGTLAEVRKDLKAIRTTIGNERARLDACLPADRSWPISRWRSYYLDHPVTGRLARALIWTFTAKSGAAGSRAGGHAAAVTGIPVGTETLVTHDGTEVPMPAGDATEVRLWHPVHATADEVRAWRQLLVGRQLIQPVKQAFREVYVLTPAEEATRDYSNRFAGHVFRQEQARALLKGRSWAPLPMAAWDDGIDHGIARREYPRAGAQALRAEFFFDPADYDDLAGNALYRYCASDQVRFFDAGTDDAVPLAEVPPLTFSEAMRDLDLVIGVTSIGADPEWLDRGEGRRFETYWHRYAFGELGAGAQVRREVLAGLAPMLAIAGRCELEDRFLVVRGDLRTYRIHLGSGNILMSPNDQYLCIVAGGDARSGRLFLPFDDDPVLSLILSKAFLLADDTKITDRSITRQIRDR